MNKFSLSIIAIAVALFSSACIVETRTPPNGGYYYASAPYDVTEIDFVTDDYGYRQVATCTGTLDFSGWFDPACDALTSSDAMYEDLDCQFYDEVGDPNYYIQTFYFDTGYVSELCSYSTVAQKSGVTSEMAIDPKTQPLMRDGQMHAVVTGRIGPKKVEKRLGKNVTLEEWLKTNSAKRVRNTSKPIVKR